MPINKIFTRGVCEFMDKYAKLVELALLARENAYAPYSSFKVGASLLTKNGLVYSGCNVENASYSETVCAERVALLKAVSEGVCDFVAMCIVGGKGDILSFTYPCGACRQALSEFAGEDFEIVLYDGENIERVRLDSLLPNGFSKNSIC